MSNQKRFHIWFGEKRTTISVDTTLCELLAIKLRYQPDDEYAHSAVREWLQGTIISNLGEQPGRKRGDRGNGQYPYAKRRLVP